MKKITYLLALFLVAQTSLFAQYTSVPDPVLENALAPYDDIAMDGQVPTAAMEAETGLLYLGTLAITNFAGIEAFINLTQLDIEYNTAVTSLDVSALTSLIRLDIEGCSSLNSITMPGAGSQLLLFEGNDAALTSVDLSNNTLLDEVYLRANQLSMLDLSDNLALTIVECSRQSSTGGAPYTTLLNVDMSGGDRSGVTLFDASFNENLVCVYVDDPGAVYITEPTWFNDGGASYCMGSLGIEEQTLSSFLMYPNPTRGSLSILSKTDSSKLDVYSITGKLILSKELSFGENKVAIESLSSGVYLARFSSGNRSETKKLIVN